MRIVLLSSVPVMTNVGFANFASASQAPLQLVFSQITRLFCLFAISGGKPGFNCCNDVVFAGMSTDSGCSLTHPDPNEATLSAFNSSVMGIFCRDLFTTSACNFRNSTGLGMPSFPPHDEATSISLLTFSGWLQ